MWNPGERLLRGAMESTGGQFGNVGLSGGLLLLQRVKRIGLEGLSIY